jgi:hypothetical protein
VIGVGGFLGVGEHLVAVPFEKVKFVNEPVAYTGASNDGAKSTGAGSSTTTDDEHDVQLEAEPLVSRSRCLQRDQGRAEGDARVSSTRPSKA